MDNPIIMLRGETYTLTTSPMAPDVRGLLPRELVQVPDKGYLLVSWDDANIWLEQFVGGWRCVIESKNANEFSNAGAELRSEGKTPSEAVIALQNDLWTLGNWCTRAAGAL